MTAATTLWAPAARRVDLHLPATGHVRPMAPAGSGWWTAPPLAHGTDYGFALDGGPVRPDPRTAWQPAGVHGPSRVFDTSRHHWSDTGWAGRDVRGAVVYELHVGTFSPAGTLDGAVDRLDHLADLGVDMVELMPVAAFPGRHGWGYDGVALYAVHEPYGGPAALQRFVDEAHARGLAVCLDVVHNHLGPSGNYLAEFGPYFTPRHHTPWGPGVNLDGSDAAPVRAFVLNSVVRWLEEFHLDALRLDAVQELADDSPRHLLAEMSDVVAEVAARTGRPRSLVAESDLNDAVMVTPTAQGGLGMTAQWADDVHHALHTVLSGERHGHLADFGTVEGLAHALRRVFVNDGRHSTFRAARWGRPVPPGTDGHRFVVCTSNHDQVGNRALGDRPSASLPADALAVSAALVLTSACTPMLFMGEEWGASTPFLFFTDHEEPMLAASVREGREVEFGGAGWAGIYGHDVEVPDPQDPTSFSASRLDWSEPAQPGHRRLLDWYRRLVELRRAEPDLADGDLDAVRVVHGDGWLVMARGELRIAVGWGEGSCELPLDGEAVEVVTAWDPVRVHGGTVTLDGPGCAVVRVGPVRSP